jgi:hypothetical protein
MIDHATKCAILGKVADFLDTVEGGSDVITAVISEHRPVLTTDDVSGITLWSKAHIVRLCKQGLLPHIPSNPHRFLHGPLMQALHEMQIGGPYGRKKSRRKKESSLGNR